MHVLGEKGKLNDQTLAFFESGNTRLEKVALHNACNLTRKGLRALRNHHIVDLEASGLNVTVGDLISSLNDWTLQNLRSLNVSGSSFVDSSKVALTVSLCQLRNLRVLSVSHTEFNHHGLEMVVEDLKHLESLDISETGISDISPLRSCRDRLQALVMHNLKISNAAVDVIVELVRLRHLDVSRDTEFSRFQGYVLFDYMTSSLSVNHLLSSLNLKYLESLDISGYDGIQMEDTLIPFIRSHPRLNFLGLLDSEACFADVFCDRSHPDFRESLVVRSHTIRITVTEMIGFSIESSGDGIGR